MYKLLIVDDEEAIREGLSNIVDWKSLGYEVVQAVEDGEDAVEYIKKASVDVILTDIKMTFMSGLELAKYVHENKPGIKVVIISGHKEFEFARQAMNYNVKHYLLKPTRLDELKKVFAELKQELDNENKEKEIQKSEKQQHRELLILSQDQFFTDLTMGALRNKEDIDRRLKKIGLDVKPSECKLCIINLNFTQSNAVIASDMEIGKDSIYATLRNYIINGKGTIQYFTLYNSSENIQVLALADSALENDVLEASIKSYFGGISSKIRAILGISITAEVERVFNSMYDTAIHFKPVASPSYSRENKLEDLISSVDYSLLVKQQKVFLSYINSDDLELAENLFENIIDELRFMDKKILHNFIIDLFANLRNKLEEFDIDTGSSMFDYEVVLKLYDINEIKLWGKNTLSTIVKSVKKHKDTSEKNVIQKAKEYINNNFDKEIGLEEVADYVFLSSIYFSRLFKQQTGENFVDYLMKVRMRKAMELLKEPKCKIYEISLRVGYKNTKYFYKLFKEHTGLTPAEYRENVLKEG